MATLQKKKQTKRRLVMNEKFIICILKCDAIVVLHSDAHFYNGIISTRGCNPVERKTRKGAEKIAIGYRKNLWGFAFACTYKEKDALEDAIKFVYDYAERRKKFLDKADELRITIYNR